MYKMSMFVNCLLLLSAPAVAFSATLQTHQAYEFIGPFKEDFILKYNNIITNVGGAYNKSTGNQSLLILKMIDRFVNDCIFNELISAPLYPDLG